MYFPLFVEVLCLSLFWCTLLRVSFEFCNHLDEEERSGCSTVIYFWVSYYCICSLALPLQFVIVVF